MAENKNENEPRTMVISVGLQPTRARAFEPCMIVGRKNPKVINGFGEALSNDDKK